MTIQDQARDIIARSKVTLASGNSSSRGRAMVEIQDFLGVHGAELDRVGNSDLVDELGRVFDQLGGKGAGQATQSPFGAFVNSIAGDVSSGVRSVLPSGATWNLLLIVAGVFALAYAWRSIK